MRLTEGIAATEPLFPLLRRGGVRGTGCQKGSGGGDGVGGGTLWAVVVVEGMTVQGGLR